MTFDNHPVARWWSKSSAWALLCLNVWIETWWIRCQSLFSIPLSFTDQSSSLSLQSLFLLISPFLFLSHTLPHQYMAFFHHPALSFSHSLSCGRLDFLFSISYLPPSSSSLSLSLSSVTSIILSPQPQASRYHRGWRAISCIHSLSCGCGERLLLYAGWCKG